MPDVGNLGNRIIKYYSQINKIDEDEARKALEKEDTRNDEENAPSILTFNADENVVAEQDYKAMIEKLRLQNKIETISLKDSKGNDLGITITVNKSETGADFSYTFVNNTLSINAVKCIVQISVDENLTTSSDIEAAELRASNIDVVLSGLHVKLNSDVSVNTITSSAINAIINGSNGADNIVATGMNTTINARGGDDTIVSNGMNGIIRGGTGDDNITVTGMGSNVFGTEGNNNIFAQGFNMFIDTGKGVGEVEVYGNSIAISGGVSGNNTITGQGQDITVISGNASNDIVLNGDNAAVLYDNNKEGDVNTADNITINGEEIQKKEVGGSSEFDENGFRSIVGEDGLTRKLNFNGYDENGYDVNGYNVQGYNAQGVDKDGYDINGYKDGYDKDGYNVNGYKADGTPKGGYDEYGYDLNGYDKDGYNMWGVDRDGKQKQHPDGLDSQGRLWKNGQLVNGQEDELFYEDGYKAQGVVCNEYTNNVPTLYKQGKLDTTMQVVVDVYNPNTEKTETTLFSEGYICTELTQFKEYWYYNGGLANGKIGENTYIDGVLQTDSDEPEEPNEYNKTTLLSMIGLPSDAEIFIASNNGTNITKFTYVKDGKTHTYDISYNTSGTEVVITGEETNLTTADKYNTAGTLTEETKKYTTGNNKYYQSVVTFGEKNSAVYTSVNSGTVEYTISDNDISSVPNVTQSATGAVIAYSNTANNKTITSGNVTIAGNVVTITSTDNSVRKYNNSGVLTDGLDKEGKLWANSALVNGNNGGFFYVNGEKANGPVSNQYNNNVMTLYKSGEVDTKTQLVNNVDGYVGVVLFVDGHIPNGNVEYGSSLYINGTKSTNAEDETSTNHLYRNGDLVTEDYALSATNKLYEKGTLSVGLKQYSGNNLWYYNGEVASGEIGDKYYEAGVYVADVYTFNNASNEKIMQIDGQRLKITAGFDEGAEGNSRVIIYREDGSIKVYNDAAKTLNFNSNADLTITIAENNNEQFTLYGGNGNDNITVEENVSVCDIHAYAGDDTIINNGTVTDDFRGGSGNDVIINNGTSKYIYGDAGSDTIINNGTVKSHIYAGEGDDTVTNYADVSSIDLNAGDDMLINNGNVWDIEGDIGNDTILNNGTLKEVKGNSGDDIIVNANTGKIGTVYGNEDEDVFVNLGTVSKIDSTVETNVIKGADDRYYVGEKLFTGDILGVLYRNGIKSTNPEEEYNNRLYRNGEIVTDEFAIANDSKKLYINGKLSNGYEYCTLDNNWYYRGEIADDNLTVYTFNNTLKEQTIKLGENDVKIKATFAVNSEGNLYIIIDDEGIINISNNAATQIAFDTDNNLTINVIENKNDKFELRSGGGNDNITVEENVSIDQIFANSGDDIITNNGTVNSSIYAGGGNDRIINNGNANDIWGHPGDDTIINNKTVSNFIAGDEGDDTITNNGSVYHYIYGGEGNDVMVNNGDATAGLSGNAGDDVMINTSDGKISVYGGDGNDTAVNEGTGRMSASEVETIITRGEDEKYYVGEELYTGLILDLLYVSGSRSEGLIQYSGNNLWYYNGEIANGTIGGDTFVNGVKQNDTPQQNYNKASLLQMLNLSGDTSINIISNNGTNITKFTYVNDANKTVTCKISYTASQTTITITGEEENLTTTKKYNSSNNITEQTKQYSTGDTSFYKEVIKYGQKNSAEYSAWENSNTCIYKITDDDISAAPNVTQNSTGAVITYSGGTTKPITNETVSISSGAVTITSSDESVKKYDSAGKLTDGLDDKGILWVEGNKANGTQGKYFYVDGEKADGPVSNQYNNNVMTLYKTGEVDTAIQLVADVANPYTNKTETTLFSGGHILRELTEYGDGEKLWYYNGGLANGMINGVYYDNGVSSNVNGVLSRINLASTDTVSNFVYDKSNRLISFKVTDTANNVQEYNVSYEDGVLSSITSTKQTSGYTEIIESNYDSAGRLTRVNDKKEQTNGAYTLQTDEYTYDGNSTIVNSQYNSYNASKELVYSLRDASNSTYPKITNFDSTGATISFSATKTVHISPPQRVEIDSDGNVLIRETGKTTIAYNSVGSLANGIVHGRMYKSGSPANTTIGGVQYTNGYTTEQNRALDILLVCYSDVNIEDIDNLHSQLKPGSSYTCDYTYNVGDSKYNYILYSNVAFLDSQIYEDGVFTKEIHRANDYNPLTKTSTPWFVNEFTSYGLQISNTVYDDSGKPIVKRIDQEYYDTLEYLKSLGYDVSTLAIGVASEIMGEGFIDAQMTDAVKDDVQLYRQADEDAKKVYDDAIANGYTADEAKERYNISFTGSLENAMVKPANTVASAYNETKVGEVAIVGDTLFVNDGTSMVELNMSKEQYLEFFPPIARYVSNQQSIGDCYLIAGVFLSCMENPKTYAQLLQMFDFDDDKLTITFDGLSGYPITFDEEDGWLNNLDGVGKYPFDTRYYEEVTLREQVDSVLGIQILEQAYAMAVFAKEQDQQITNIDIDDAINYIIAGNNYVAQKYVLGIDNAKSSVISNSTDIDGINYLRASAYAYVYIMDAVQKMEGNINDEYSPILMHDMRAIAYYSKIDSGSDSYDIFESSCENGVFSVSKFRNLCTTLANNISAVGDAVTDVCNMSDTDLSYIGEQLRGQKAYTTTSLGYDVDFYNNLKSMYPAYFGGNTYEYEYIYCTFATLVDKTAFCDNIYDNGMSVNEALAIDYNKALNTISTEIKNYVSALAAVEQYEGDLNTRLSSIDMFNVRAAVYYSMVSGGNILTDCYESGTISPNKFRQIYRSMFTTVDTISIAEQLDGKLTDEDIIAVVEQLRDKTGYTEEKLADYIEQDAVVYDALDEVLYFKYPCDRNDTYDALANVYDKNAFVNNLNKGYTVEEAFIADYEAMFAYYAQGLANNSQLLGCITYEKTNNEYYITDGHAYSIENIDTANKIISFINPWSGGVSIDVSYEDFLKNFYNIQVAYV